MEADALLKGITKRLQAEQDFDPWVLSNAPTKPPVTERVTVTPTEPPAPPPAEVSPWWPALGLAALVLILIVAWRSRRSAS